MSRHLTILAGVAFAALALAAPASPLARERHVRRGDDHLVAAFQRHARHHAGNDGRTGDIGATAACASHHTTKSVWYSVTPTYPGQISIDLSGSATTVPQFAVTDRQPRKLFGVTCGWWPPPGAGAFMADAGQTYYILVVRPGGIWRGLRHRRRSAPCATPPRRTTRSRGDDDLDAALQRHARSKRGDDGRGRRRGDGRLWVERHRGDKRVVRVHSNE